MMRRLALRWAFWSTVLVLAALTTAGTWRFLDPPPAKARFETLVRRPPWLDEPADRDRFSMVARAAIVHTPSTLWPTRLPARAVLSEVGAATFITAIGWADEYGSRPEPLLRLRQESARRPLPGLDEVTVRGLPGRAGQLPRSDCGATMPFAGCGTVASVWWAEDRFSFALTSAALSMEELLEVAESLQPLTPRGPTAYQSRRAHQGGPTSAFAGLVDEFPLPSVTYLSNIEVYVVRTAAGFTALWGREVHGIGRAIKFAPSRPYFTDLAERSFYDLLGTCYIGPCWANLSRYAVRVRNGMVLVDLGTRFTDPSLVYHASYPLPTWAQSWP